MNPQKSPVDWGQYSKLLLWMLGGLVAFIALLALLMLVWMWFGLWGVLIFLGLLFILSIIAVNRVFLPWLARYQPEASETGETQQDEAL